LAKYQEQSMLPFESVKFPIIVFANYRTGSSWFCHRISQYYGIKDFKEPIRKPDKMAQLEDSLKSNENDFLVKIIPNQIPEHPIYQKLMELDSFKIKLTRRDTVAQLASYYTAWKTDRWAQRTECVPKYSLGIDTEFMEMLTGIILQNNHQLNSLPIIYDYVCDYESLEFSVSFANFQKITPPDNINEIKNRFEDILLKYHQK